MDCAGGFMAEVIRDDIDFAAYERATDPSVKVRAAASFEDELAAEFAARDASKVTEMFSTKLRGLIDFRPGEVTVWAGYNGHKKSMFTGQMTLDLCVQRRRVLVASMEMYPGKTLARMARQAYAAMKLLPAEIQRFSKWTDGRLWLFDHQGRVTPAVMLAVLRYFAEELQGEQVVIDSMMMVCASEESLDEQKQFMTDLVRVAQETGLHVHLVAHCRKPPSGDDRPPTKYDIKGSGSITDQSHNVILVYANKAKKAALEKDPNDARAQNEPDQLIIIDKQRNGEWEGKVALWFYERGLRFCDDRISNCEPYVLRD
jgi:twinkle protein